MEQTVRDIMYEIPSDETIEECIINSDVVNGLADPELLYKKSTDGKKKTNKRVKKEQEQTA